MTQIYQEKTFRAFCTLKTIYESQFKFQATGWKYNHWFEFKPVQGEHVKFLILKAQPSFLVIARVKTRPFLKTTWQGLLKEGYTNWKRTWGHGQQGLKRHKPWPIQTVKDFQDSCRLSSQLQSLSQSVS